MRCLGTVFVCGVYVWCLCGVFGVGVWMFGHGD